MRRYPESGPERRDREERQRRAYGEGEYRAEKCKECKQPFTESDIAQGVNKVRRDVHPSAEAFGVKVLEYGGTCTTCQLKAKVARLEEDADSKRRHDQAVARTCQTCGQEYRWVGTATGWHCGCGVDTRPTFAPWRGRSMTDPR